MVKAITELCSYLMKYLAARELNFKIRTLTSLYEDETNLIYQISSAHGDPDFNPDPSHIVRLKARLDQTRKLIELLETETLSGSSEHRS